MSFSLPTVLYEGNRYKVPISLYSNSDKQYIHSNFSHLASLPHVKKTIVFLPDLHHKPLLETPSSSVILTDKFFSLALTSPSQNCGMNLIMTPMSEEDISPVFIKEFMSKIRTTVPLRNNLPILSKEEVLQALKHGARWAVKRYGLPESMPDNIEHQGNLLDKKEVSSSDIEASIPQEIMEVSRSRFGIIGGGNHFLELQTVAEIFDDSIARVWGLKQNQVVIMSHTGSDALGGYLGRLYAHRRKTSTKQQLYFYRKKIRYHLLRDSWKSKLRRIYYYFSPTSFRFIDSSIPEGQRVILAINSASNFAFANRTAIIHAIRKALQETTADSNLQIDLLYDCSHNSIYEETINGKTFWAHRHNACRVYPPSLLKHHPAFAYTGQPVILPGTNQTSSFICAGREGSVATHFTVDHGLGAVQKRSENHSPPEKITNFSYLFGYEDDVPQKVPRLSDNIINEALEVLNKADIIKTVARLKPLATLKGPKQRVV